MPNIAKSRERLGRIALILLIIGTFSLDFVHGIWLGQHQILFSPIYRVRQSLAIAVSRLHSPPAKGYLAYKSVVDVFNRNGFAIFPQEPGPHLNPADWARLWTETGKLDGILQQARDVTVDRTLPPELLDANDLGYADYMYYAFRIFGLKVSSLYYLYFLILGISCGLFAIEFRRSPFLMFLLTVYVAEIYFLQDYAQSKGEQLNALYNSRLFDALSLLPAMHIVIAIWRRRTFAAGTACTVLLQSVLLAFLLTCRSAIVWQIAMILAVMAIVAISSHLPWRERVSAQVRAMSRYAWPGGIAIAVVAIAVGLTSFTADARYKSQGGEHVIWHTILAGILATSPALRAEYAGERLPENAALVDRYTDTVVYEAVIRDLNARHDASSPIAKVEPNGHITIVLQRSWGMYDKLVRSLTFRIVLAHPLQVLASFYHKIGDQILWYRDRNGLAPRNFSTLSMISGVAMVILIFACGFSPGMRQIASGAAAIAIVLLSVSVIVFIVPSALSVGSLISYIGAFVVLITCILAAILSRFGPSAKRAERVS